MRKHVAVIMSILAISTAISVASAEPDRRNGNGIDRMATRLGLDDTQKQAIENIHLAAQPEIDVLAEQIKANREARQALAERIRSEVDAVLTDEQRRLGPANSRTDKRFGDRRNKN